MYVHGTRTRDAWQIAAFMCVKPFYSNVSGAMSGKATKRRSTSWSWSFFKRWLEAQWLAYRFTCLSILAKARTVDLQKLVKRIAQLSHDMVPQLDRKHADLCWYLRASILDLHERFECSGGSYERALAASSPSELL